MTDKTQPHSLHCPSSADERQPKDSDFPLEREGPADKNASIQKEAARARDAAYRHLSYRPRSRQEVLRKLREKGFSDEVVGSVLHDLERLGYVNDREFALQWTRSRIRLRSFGRRRIEQELRDRGIDRDLIRDALSEGFEDASELDLALQEAEKKIKTLGRFDPEVRRRRVAGLLERKGFLPGIIRTVINRLKQ